MNDQNARRVVALVDMDCFYCQVEVQHDRSLVGKPVAVVQYNSWRGGGIIAVNYEARAMGVDRHMRGNDAVQKCPDLNVVRVKELHGKADLSKYRTASQEVFKVLSEFSSCVQRASIDEAYIDLTKLVNDSISSNHTVITETDLPNTFIQGYSDQNSKDRSKNVKSWLHDVYNNELQDEYLLSLTVGAMMVEKLRESIYKKTGFRCSAGISSNKILAKLACGLHKPNQQTLLPPQSVPQLFETIPIKKVKNLGGKLGNRVRREFNCEFMSDLAKIPLNDLRKKFDEKTSNFLYQISKGIDFEPVQSRLISKSIGSCKSFPLGLKVKEDVQHWLRTLINDIIEKLEADYKTNNRKPTLMTVSVRYSNKETNLPTSQCGEVNSSNANKLFESAYSMLCVMTENQKSLKWKNPLLSLSVAVGKFVEVNTSSSIDNYFNKAASKVENVNQQSLLENTASTSVTNEPSVSCTSHNEQQPVLEKIALFPNQSSNTVAQHSNFKKNEISFNGSKNIKTMFTEMQNSCNLQTRNSSETETSVNSIVENKCNSFFCNKLKTISLVKNSENSKLSVDDECHSKNSLNNLEIISPLKNEEKEDQFDKKTLLLGSFFSRKLEAISPAKIQTDLDSMSATQSPVTKNCIEDNPFMLLCEHCNKMIDIDQYDEHIDYHVAINLSKSLNSADKIQAISADVLHNNVSPKKKNERGQKRKHNSKASKSNSKKSCASISSYFKPVLNP